MDSKQRWRQAILEKRSQLSPKESAQASARILTRFFSLEEVRLADRLGLYAAFQNEVSTEKIFGRAHALRKEIYYPAVDLADRSLHFYRVRDLRELRSGFAGILEPDAKGNRLRNINYLHLIVVPGVAFGSFGNRLGRGEGYYDRLLEKYHGLTIGLAYEFQMVEALPTTPRDQRLDLIITEEKVYKCIL